MLMQCGYFDFFLLNFERKIIIILFSFTVISLLTTHKNLNIHLCHSVKLSARYPLVISFLTDD